MKGTTENKDFDKNALKQIMNEKGFTNRKLADACGLGHSTIDKYLHQENAPAHVVRLITLVLGCTEEDLERKPMQSASSIINDAIRSDEIDGLKREISALRTDLQNMAKMLIQINKTANETKAQAELNAEQLTATFNKQTETASNVAKIYGKINHKY